MFTSPEGMQLLFQLQLRFSRLVCLCLWFEFFSINSLLSPHKTIMIKTFFVYMVADLALNPSLTLAEADKCLSDLVVTASQMMKYLSVSVCLLLQIFQSIKGGNLLCLLPTPYSSCQPNFPLELKKKKRSPRALE